VRTVSKRKGQCSTGRNIEELLMVGASWWCVLGLLLLRKERRERSTKCYCAMQNKGVATSEEVQVLL
jgi:hypothetical protein